MQIDFETFLSIVDVIFDSKKPVLIRGRHGIGKSEVVYQTAARRNLQVVERRASQMTEGDLVGLPSLGDNRTSWNPPDWFKHACEEPVMLFLDEIDRAVIEVRQGIFELTDSRKLNGHKLHPDTLIVAAVNGGQSGEQYQVGEMDPAELDRWTVFDLNPTVEDWLNWAKKGNIESVITDFITLDRTHLEHVGDFEPNKKYPSRRSWKRFNDALKGGGLTEKWDNKVIFIGLGYLGYEAAIAFSDFYKNYEQQVTPDDIIVHGKFDKVKNFTLIEHCALIEKMVSTNVFDETLGQQELVNLSTYFSLSPSESAMKLWKVMGEGKAGLDNTVNLHATKTIDGKSIGDILCEIYSDADHDR